MEIDEVVSDRKISEDIQSSGARCMQQTVTIILEHHHIKVTKIMDILQTPAPKKFRINNQASCSIRYFHSHHVDVF
jgi:hypothetical protein